MRYLGHILGELPARIRIYRLETDDLVCKADRWDELKPLRTDRRYRYVVDGQCIEPSESGELREKGVFPKPWTKRHRGSIVATPRFAWLLRMRFGKRATYHPGQERSTGQSIYSNWHGSNIDGPMECPWALSHFIRRRTWFLRRAKSA